MVQCDNVEESELDIVEFLLLKLDLYGHATLKSICVQHVPKTVGLALFHSSYATVQTALIRRMGGAERNPSPLGLSWTQIGIKPFVDSIRLDTNIEAKEQLIANYVTEKKRA